jgi:hypothetical protein
MKIMVIVLIWFMVSVFNFGALNADIHHQHFYCNGLETPRHQATLLVALALAPVIGTALALFDTGFLESGWSLEIGCRR